MDHRRVFGSSLHCARCDAQVPEGSDVCPWNAIGSTGTGRGGTPCGSHAFYRRGAKPVRHIMGAAIEEPEIEAEEPVRARAKNYQVSVSGSRRFPRGGGGVT